VSRPKRLESSATAPWEPQLWRHEIFHFFAQIEARPGLGVKIMCLGCVLFGYGTLVVDHRRNCHLTDHQHSPDTTVSHRLTPAISSHHHEKLGLSLLTVIVEVLGIGKEMLRHLRRQWHACLHGDCFSSSVFLSETFCCVILANSLYGPVLNAECSLPACFTSETAWRI
jgi:hypothetical protein